MRTSVRFKLFVLKVLRRLRVIGEKRYLDFRDYVIVESSSLFDADWYLANNPDVMAKGNDPIWHYCNYGWKEGRIPGPNISRELIPYSPRCVFECRGLLDALGKSCTGGCLGTGGDAFPAGTENIEFDGCFSPTRTGRTAVFAVYSADGKIPEATLYYLKGLKEVVDNIVVVSDNPIFPKEENKLKGLVCHGMFARHGEYDFGSYKRGLFFVMRHRVLRKSRELVLCNDSCYAPVQPFGPVFEKMGARNLDFWGMCSNLDVQYHIQSYFWVLKRKVFTSDVFLAYFTKVHREANVREVVLNYEVPFTKAMQDAGFTADAFINFTMPKDQPPRIYRNNPTAAPIYCMEAGSPLLKVKAIRKLDTNTDGILNTFRCLQGKNPDLAKMLKCHLPDYGKIRFSVIMPTYNRIDCIDKAIDAMLGQSFTAFELLIVDDGSTDGTENHLRERYAGEIKRGIIRYSWDRNEGVCRARNRGLRMARNEWIAYADSDNVVSPSFLELMADAIRKCPDRKAFYGQFKTMKSCQKVGRPFDFETLVEANFIDLGTYVHHRSLVEELGGFDEDMTRLVDWDLIVRYSERYPPAYIAQILLLYNDFERGDRISRKADYFKNLLHMRRKRGRCEIVTTVITSYNHEKYIAKAIESALMQKGDFVHEILISDDGSTDGTREDIRDYARRYPCAIRDISSDKNRGIAENMRHCFAEAAGKYVAVLEGDDVWTWDSKLCRQVEFLENNPSCPMVFSRINVCNDATGRQFILDRQKDLPSLLTGEDFIRDPNQNLIANFSSCMFVTKVMKALPEIIYSTRFNEIACAFCLERMGPIGFMPITMSNYYIHAGSTWSTADEIRKIQSAIRCREVALELCAPKYKERMKAIIGHLRESLKAAQLKLQEKGAR